MLRLPTSLNDIRTLLATVDLITVQSEIGKEIGARIAIVGPVNAGKSTLFNLLKGRSVSPVSPVPGTTTRLIREDLGPIVLIDTPGFGEVGGVDRAAVAWQAIAEADLVVLLLDAAAGVDQDDADLYRQLADGSPPVVVALNKVDLIRRDLLEVVRDAGNWLGVSPIPISAKTGWNVSNGLMAEIFARGPALSVALGRELPRFRRQAGTAVIRQAAAITGMAGAEPIPFVDIPVLVAAQARMVLRLAAIYGESMDISHARELLSAIAGGLVLRYLAREAVKVIPGPTWLVAGGLAAANTWAVGQVAVAYFESGKQLTPPQMRAMYDNLVSRRQPKHLAD